MATIQDQISVTCSNCQKSTVVNFISKHGHITVDQEECPKCGDEWLNDVIGQIEVDLDDLPSYDLEIDQARQEEYDEEIKNCLYEYID